MNATIYDSSNFKQLDGFTDMVAEVILQGQTSLFIGAGSSIQYDIMSWDELMNNISPDTILWKNTDRAQYTELVGGYIKEEICKTIGNINIDPKKEKTFLNYLLDFDYQSIWTTNYDSVIEDVLEYKSKYCEAIYKYNHFQKLSYPNGNLLFKINGSYSASDTIVITSEDFIDYRRTHEAYLILLKRELLCNNMFFLGCSFNDDILRISIKDILNCIDNSSQNYSTNHYAIIVESDILKLNYIANDLSKHYKINCLKVKRPQYSYLIAYGIACKIKYSSIFVSGAKRFIRYSKDEENGKKVCQELVEAFLNVNYKEYKFISGMGMSIGHFICGTVKNKCNEKNIKRHLQMEPFPFTTAEANSKHRSNIIKKAGIFLFLYGDYDNNYIIEETGMWEEYIKAKSDKDNIIVSLPCKNDSISYYIFLSELDDKNSFSYKNKSLIEKFNCDKDNKQFFYELSNKITETTNDKINKIFKHINSMLS